jgi:hypothetical protein
LGPLERANFRHWRTPVNHWKKSRNPVILLVIHHRQSPLQLRKLFGNSVLSTHKWSKRRIEERICAWYCHGPGSTQSVSQEFICR